MTAAADPAGDDVRDVPAQVARTREALAALLERLDPAAAARAAAPPPPARPTVVLAGAPGRGRGELLAALLGLDAVPERSADGTLRATIGDGRWAPGLVAAGVPLLEELDLLVPGRAGAAADPGAWPVDGATAALVLADAAAPLGAEELDALARAAGRVDTVVFALTRTEAHRGWRTVLEADRALVAERVPRLGGAPWFPVSAALARRAGTLTGDGAAALRRRSGVAALQRELHRLVARRRRMLAEANALRLLAAQLDAVATRAEATRAALREPAGATPALARRRDELLAAGAALRRDHHTRWRTGLAAARVAAADDLAARVRAAAAATRARIDDADRAGLAAVPRELAGEVEALAAAVVDGLGARLRDLVAATLADLVPAGELAALRVAEVAVAADPAAALVAPPRTRPAEDRLLVVAGAAGGLGLSRLALLPLLAVPIAPAALGVALVPVSVGLGLGAAGWVARARRLAADRAHLRQWAAEALAEVRGDLDRVLADALITTEREVTLALDAALETRARDLDDALDAAERAVRHAGADRAEADRVAARTVAEAREGRDRAEALLRRLAALRDRVEVAGTTGESSGHHTGGSSGHHTGESSGRSADETADVPEPPPHAAPAT